MKAKDFLTEDNWCKGAMAMTADGITVNEDDPKACKFCLVGAIAKIYTPQTPACREAFKKVRAALNLDLATNIAKFNDLESTTFADVKRVLELADV